MPAEMKTFEVRDEGTEIPVVAIRIFPSVRESDYPWRRAGYGVAGFYVLLTNLTTNKTDYDAYSWGNRTLKTAHLHMIENWTDLVDGQVIDSEFLLGLSKEPKTHTGTRI